VVPTPAGRAKRSVLRFLQRADVRLDPITFTRRRLYYELAQQLAPSALAKERIVTFDRDLRLAVRLDDPITRSIYLYGYHEFRVASVFSALVKPGMVVLDAGAHEGQYTVLAAKRVGSTGQVIAVEPDYRARKRLIRNVELNRFSNVSVVPLALSSQRGSASLFRPSAPALYGQASLRRAWLASGSVDVATVQTERLDAVLDELHCRRLNIIKVDVEGFERQVLDGGTKTIADNHPVVIFEVNDVRVENGDHNAPAMDLLRDLGYRIYGIVMDDRARWRLAELVAGEDPMRYREPWQALNLVALHNMDQPRG
jgi:FkbM family methyltransferase